MIVDLARFIRNERPAWERLAALLERAKADPHRRPPLEEMRELERLYQRASADLARLSSFTAEPEARRHLEALVASAYAEIHGSTSEPARFRPWHWLTTTLPATFQRHVRNFLFALGLLLAGGVFGAFALAIDPDAKPLLMPFPHLLKHPSARVAEEEMRTEAKRDGHATFSGSLMVHNTRVALTSLALGMTWGVGTVLFILYNGILVGAVAFDYLRAGEGVFLAGWLLPHGTVEIPALLIGGQGGLVLARAMLNRSARLPLAGRMRAIAPDVVTLAAGAALLLVWAGIVESFLSQYHEPIVPYWAKIAFGCAQGAVLLWFLFVRKVPSR
ncbi:stage II sporulation protein M [Nibricoccus sp. IMCC34717]|uniref:stage II sporulation protein M n=1 Tax=Nibricoccus sp. IMCC34717 TaxID=3034021 RepID=UPI00384E4F3D